MKIKQYLLLSVFCLMLSSAFGASVEKTVWLSKKMEASGTDIPSLFKSVEKGSIINIIENWIPKVCDFSKTVAIYSRTNVGGAKSAACVYVGYVRD